MGFFGSTKKKTPSSKTKKHHSFRHGASTKAMVQAELREDAARAALSLIHISEPTRPY